VRSKETRSIARREEKRGESHDAQKESQEMERRRRRWKGEKNKAARVRTKVYM